MKFYISADSKELHDQSSLELTLQKVKSYEAQAHLERSKKFHQYFRKAKYFLTR